MPEKPIPPDFPHLPERLRKIVPHDEYRDWVDKMEEWRIKLAVSTERVIRQNTNSLQSGILKQFFPSAIAVQVFQDPSSNLESDFFNPSTKESLYGDGAVYLVCVGLDPNTFGPAVFIATAPQQLLNRTINGVPDPLRVYGDNIVAEPLGFYRRLTESGKSIRNDVVAIEMIGIGGGAGPNAWAGFERTQVLVSSSTTPATKIEEVFAPSYSFVDNRIPWINDILIAPLLGFSGGITEAKSTPFVDSGFRYRGTSSINGVDMGGVPVYLGWMDVNVQAARWLPRKLFGINGQSLWNGSNTPSAQQFSLFDV